MAIRNLLDTLPKKNSRILVYVILACLLYLGVTAYWNWAAPFGDDYGPYIIQDLITFLPAVAAAILGTILLHQFDRGDKPRRIWFWFVAGWWAWVVGDFRLPLMTSSTSPVVSCRFMISFGRPAISALAFPSSSSYVTSICLKENQGWSHTFSQWS
jgi:hypothetical protein